MFLLWPATSAEGSAGSFYLPPAFILLMALLFPTPFWAYTYSLTDMMVESSPLLVCEAFSHFVLLVTLLQLRGRNSSCKYPGHCPLQLDLMAESLPRLTCMLELSSLTCDLCVGLPLTLFASWLPQTSEENLLHLVLLVYLLSWTGVDASYVDGRDISSWQLGLMAESSPRLSCRLLLSWLQYFGVLTSVLVSWKSRTNDAFLLPHPLLASGVCNQNPLGFGYLDAIQNYS